MHYKACNIHSLRHPPKCLNQNSSVSCRDAGLLAQWFCVYLHFIILEKRVYHFNIKEIIIGSDEVMSFPKTIVFELLNVIQKEGFWLLLFFGWMCCKSGDEWNDYMDRFGLTESKASLMVSKLITVIKIAS